MEVSKRSNSVDRLSELPESLIFHIFSLMAMTDVVKTTILSKRWLDLWTTVSTLNFYDFSFGTNPDPYLYNYKVQTFINRSLIFWRGERIQKLTIDLNSMLFHQAINSDDIDVWLLFAKKYEVEAVRLYQAAHALYSLPQCLYSCSSLKSLTLEGCQLQIPTVNLNWGRLEYLRLANCAVRADLINKVLSSSTKLRDLHLSFIENNESMIIESSSLRHLYIDKFMGHDNPPVSSKKLRISTPNLEFLQISGVSYSECVLNAVPRLHTANLLLDGQNAVAGKTLMQLLINIKHVKTLSLTDWCIKELGDMNDKGMLSPFANVETLRLIGCIEKYEQIVRLLQVEVFPELEVLDVIRQEKCWGESVKLEANLPGSFLQKLRIVVVVWYDHYYGAESMLPFLEILLKYASKLKEMVFLISGTATPSDSFVSALRRMPRSSPTAQLIFRKNQGK